MNKQTFLLILLGITFSSCGVFSRYHNGQHRYFNQALTKEEKAKIYATGTIVKQWVGTNNLGDSLIGNLLVEPIWPKGYEFIEQGTWKHNYAVTRNGRKNEL